MKTITALDLRKKLGSVLNAVSVKKERVMVSRANKPLAVIISVDEYQERVLKAERGRKLREIAAKMDVWKASHHKGKAAFDTVEAIRRARDNR